MLNTVFNRDVTKFEFEFYDIRILATYVIFDNRCIDWSFSVEFKQSKNYLSLKTATGAHVQHVCSWFSAARAISICYNLQT